MTNFNVAEIVVTHTYHYTPDDYLDYCAHNDELPTTDGLIRYLQTEIDADFPNSSSHPFTIIYNDHD